MNTRPIRRALAMTCVTAAIAGCATMNNNIRNNHAMAVYQHGDCKKAFGEFVPLAENGLAAAQNNLGVIYDAGCPSAGIPQDHAEAFHWYSVGARNGNPMAMRNLGYSYQHGLGIMRNDNVARDWYITAARWGNEQAKQDLEALGIPAPDPDLLEQARAEKRHEIFNDTVAVLLGATLGIAAAHNHVPLPTTFYGASAGRHQNDDSNSPSEYHGAFTGTQPSNGTTAQSPTGELGTFYYRPGTSLVQQVGDTTRVTRPDGTTLTSTTVGNMTSGRVSTGQTWSEIKSGDRWSGEDSDGLTWTRRQAGENMVYTFSNGKTLTCRIAGDQLTCY